MAWGVAVDVLPRTFALLYVAWSVPFRCCFLEDFAFTKRFAAWWLVDYGCDAVLCTLLLLDAWGFKLLVLPDHVQALIDSQQYNNESTSARRFRLFKAGFGSASLKREKQTKLLRTLVFLVAASAPVEFAAIHYGSFASLSLFKLNRLLHLLDAPRVGRTIFVLLEDSTHVAGGALRLCYLYLLMAMAAHTGACLFYLASRIDALPPRDWTRRRVDSTWGEYDQLWSIDIDGNIKYNSTVKHRYFRALYWAINMMVTTGFGDINPLTRFETLCSVSFMFLGLLITGAGIGNITLLFMQTNRSNVLLDQKLDAVETYGKYRSLPQTTGQRMSDYVEWAAKRGFDDDKFLSELPPSLLTAMLKVRVCPLLRRLPCLGEDVASDALVNALAVKLTTKLYAPYDDVVRPAELLSGALVVAHGELGVRTRPDEVYWAECRVKFGKRYDAVAPAADATKHHFKASTVHSHTSLRRGDYFGATSLFCSRIQCRSLVLAHSYCEVNWLSRADMLVVCREQCTRDQIEAMFAAVLRPNGGSVKGLSALAHAGGTGSRSVQGLATDHKSRSNALAKGLAGVQGLAGALILQVESRKRRMTATSLDGRPPRSSKVEPEDINKIRLISSAALRKGGARDDEDDSDDEDPGAPGKKKSKNNNKNKNKGGLSPSNLAAVPLVITTKKEPSATLLARENQAWDNERRLRTVEAAWANRYARLKPDRPWRKLLEVLRGMLLWYNSIVIPLLFKTVYTRTFASDGRLTTKEASFFFSYAVDLFFLADLFMYTTIVPQQDEKGMLIARPEALRALFRRTHSLWVLEVLALLPWDLLAFLPAARRSRYSWWALARVAKAPHVMLRIAPQTEEVCSYVKVISKQFIRILQLNAVMLLLTHYVGVGFMLAARVTQHDKQRFEHTWIYADWHYNSGVDRVEDGLDCPLLKSIAHSGSATRDEMRSHYQCSSKWALCSKPSSVPYCVYLRAIYFAMLAMSTLGYGDMVPTRNNFIEVLYVTITVLFGGLLLPAMVGGLASLIADLNTAYRDYRSKSFELRTSMRRQKLPAALQNALLKYHNYVWTRHKGADERSVLRELPAPLRRCALVQAVGPAFAAAPFFSRTIGVEEFARQELISRLAPRVFLPGDVVLAEGDLSRLSLFFIERGDVDEFAARAGAAKLAAMRAHLLQYIDTLSRGGDHVDHPTLTHSAIRRGSLGSVTHPDDQGPNGEPLKRLSFSNLFGDDDITNNKSKSGGPTGGAPLVSLAIHALSTSTREEQLAESATQHTDDDVSPRTQAASASSSLKTFKFRATDELIRRCTGPRGSVDGITAESVRAVLAEANFRAERRQQAKLAQRDEEEEEEDTTTRLVPVRRKSRVGAALKTIPSLRLTRTSSWGNFATPPAPRSTRNNTSTKRLPTGRTDPPAQPAPPRDPSSLAFHAMGQPTASVNNNNTNAGSLAAHAAVTTTTSPLRSSGDGGGGGGGGGTPSSATAAALPAPNSNNNNNHNNNNNNNNNAAPRVPPLRAAAAGPPVTSATRPPPRRTSISLASPRVGASAASAFSFKLPLGRLLSGGGNNSSETPSPQGGSGTTTPNNKKKTHLRPSTGRRHSAETSEEADLSAAAGPLTGRRGMPGVSRRGSNQKSTTPNGSRPSSGTSRSAFTPRGSTLKNLLITPRGSMSQLLATPRGSLTQVLAGGSRLDLPSDGGGQRTARGSLRRGGFFATGDESTKSQQRGELGPPLESEGSVSQLDRVRRGSKGLGGGRSNLRLILGNGLKDLGRGSLLTMRSGGGGRPKKSKGAKKGADQRPLPYAMCAPVTRRHGGDFFGAECLLDRVRSSQDRAKRLSDRLERKKLWQDDATLDQFYGGDDGTVGLSAARCEPRTSCIARSYTDCFELARDDYFDVIRGFPSSGVFVQDELRAHCGLDSKRIEATLDNLAQAYFFSEVATKLNLDEFRDLSIVPPSDVEAHLLATNPEVLSTVVATSGATGGAFAEKVSKDGLPTFASRFHALSTDPVAGASTLNVLAGPSQNSVGGGRRSSSSSVSSLIGKESPLGRSLKTLVSTRNASRGRHQQHHRRGASEAKGDDDDDDDDDGDMLEEELTAQPLSSMRRQSFDGTPPAAIAAARTNRHYMEAHARRAAATVAGHMKSTFGDPESPGQIAWAAMMSFVLTYQAFSTPLHCAFITQNPVFYASDWVLDVVAIVDAILTATTFGLMHDGQLVLDAREIFEVRRKAGRVTGDVCYCMPIDFLAYLAPRRYMSFVRALLRLPKLVRATRFPAYADIGRPFFEDIEARILTKRLAALARLGGIVLLVSHFFACIYYAMARWKWLADAEPPDLVHRWSCTWIRRQITNRDLKLYSGFIGDSGVKDAAEQYLRALNWSLATLVAVCIGDVRPYTCAETLWVYIAAAIGMSVSATIIGSVVAALHDSSSSGELAKRADRLERYMQQHGVPLPLRTRVNEFTISLQSANVASEFLTGLRDPATSLLESTLPHTLRARVCAATRTPVLEDCPLFEPCSEVLKRLIALTLVPETYSAGDLIMQYGELGEAMYFLLTGTVTVLGQNNTTVYATLKSGSFFGEGALFSNVRRAASIKCAGFTECFRLSRSDLQAQLKAFRFKPRRLLDKFNEIRKRNAKHNAAIQAGLKEATTAGTRLSKVIDVEEATMAQSGIPAQFFFHNDASSSSSSSAEAALGLCHLLVCWRPGGLRKCLASWRRRFQRQLSESLEPGKHGRAVWDMVEFGFALYLAGVTPFRAAFYTQREDLRRVVPRALWFDWGCVDVLFLLGMLARLDMKPKEQGRFEDDANSDLCGRRYRESRTFWIDVASVAPTELIAIAWHLLVAGPRETNLAAAKNVVLALRMNRLLRLNKLVHLFESISRYALRRHGIRVSVAEKELIWIIFVYIMVIHWHACGWFALHRYAERNAKYTWATFDNLATARDAGLPANETYEYVARVSVIDCYVRAVHYAITVLSSTGNGDIKPMNPLETCYMLIVIITGACLLSSLISAWTLVLEAFDTEGLSAFNAKMHRYEAYMEAQRLPPRLREQILEHHRHVWTKQLCIDETAFTNDLTWPLKMDLALCVHHEAFMRVKFFSMLPESNARRLAAYAQTQLCEAGDPVYVDGDVGYHVYFLFSGRCTMVHVGPDHGPKRVIHQGDHFGELCIESQSGVRHETVTADVRSELYCLDRKDLDDEVKKLLTRRKGR